MRTQQFESVFIILVHSLVLYQLIDKAIEVYDDLMDLVRQNQDSSEILMIDQMLERMIHIVQKAQSFEER